jgi:SAM-dependent methyltransferase
MSPMAREVNDQADRGMGEGRTMRLPSAPGPNADQDAYWNGEEASHWVAQLDRYDEMLQPFNHHLLPVAKVNRTDTTLDIGCGCGATTLEAAQLAPNGLVVGVDLSRPMIDFATDRARRTVVDNVRFNHGDVEVYPFNASAFDRAISRFGVMFFGDPVAAFSNIARSLRPSGTLTFVCWQEPLRNEWIAVPGAAVAAHVPLPDVTNADAPGPFSLADPDRIRDVLGQSGFDHFEIASVEVPLRLGATVEDTVAFLATTGMGRAMLADVEAPTQTRALAAVSEALSPYESGDGVRLGSSAWLVTAGRRP